jgi:hypothetical protein
MSVYDAPAFGLPTKDQSFVDQYSKQPTPERTFMIKFCGVARRCEPTVEYSKLHSFGTAQHTARCEVKQPATAPEPLFKYL